eukprot:CAMPEP_0197827158 /NCGR_PEP_ID=MMETSP1437-20131217/4005_1 /TAXON_ID=49252 ORGANISM="Eucampia antarctica, Strain CCMP1452" /NCGR_SAMPLE_ID=MMETSP1437 /ASSEMBLY_ACC=CAM_ASM_001096 /LENGTH=561 /DNA_ID=CAMNT_0043427903 /DNA_START=82 /DNA_END=1767 /DNA_ORIENTATION=+
MASSGSREQGSNAEDQLQRAMMNHLQKYPIQLKYPARIADEKSSNHNDGSPTPKESTSASLWTSSDFVQQRLLDAGVTFDKGNQRETGSSDPTLTEMSNSLDKFVVGMETTGCYESVKVILDRDGQSPAENGKKQNLVVSLAEKTWYKLYVGGGVKGDPFANGGQDLHNTKLQLETSIGLRNLFSGGCCDITNLSYAVDQTSTPSFQLTHDRPLFPLLPPHAPAWRQSLHQLRAGNPWHAHFRASVDTLDHLHTRSCRERQSSLQMVLSNTPSTNNKVDAYKAFKWIAVLRDVMPRRDASLPYKCDSSAELLSHVGPSFKHSVLYEYKLNKSISLDPDENEGHVLSGYQANWSFELAGPPGDVGFFKGWGGLNLNIPLLTPLNETANPAPSFASYLLQGLTFHAALQGGFLRNLAFGDLCNNNKNSSNICDRFFVGGPNQLRGFMQAGIGPRAKTGGSSVPGGDAMGADLYYTTTLATSIPFPTLANTGIRLFSFVNAGALTNRPLSLLATTRVSIGGGVSANLPHVMNGARLEATYAIPLRYGHRDARRHVQAGMGFSIG